MAAYLGGLTLGFVFALLALGLLVSYRVLREIDLTAEGAFALGGCTAASLITAGWDPFVSTGAAMLAGGAAGLVSGGLAAVLRQPLVLTGILVSTALMSVHILVLRGRGNLPLLADDTPTLMTHAERLGSWMFDGKRFVDFAGSRVASGEIAAVLGAAALVLAMVLALRFFFTTHLGVALRAGGDNPQMAASFGVSSARLRLVGLSLSNACAGLCGAIAAQYTGFADFRAGVGVLVVGLASLLLGESLVGRGGIGRLVLGAVLGALVCRLVLVACLNELRIPPNLLHLVVGGILVVVLFLQGALRRRAAGNAWS